MRLIDADKLKEHIDKLPALPDGNFAGNHSALKALINMQPTIEQPTNCSEFPNNSDTISRQAAVDALKTDMASLDHIINGMSGYDVRFDAYVSQRNQVDYDIDTISNLPTAQPEQRWIPVTERLPNKQTKVLVVDFGEVDTAYLNSEGRWRDFHGNKLKDVKAWMPLPKWEGDAE